VASRNVPDLALGVLLAVAGALAIWDASALPNAGAERLHGPGTFLNLLGFGLLLVGAALIVRSRFIAPAPAVRWSAVEQLVILIALGILIVGFSYRPYSRPWMLEWGPAELAALHISELAVAVALARASHLRALGMAGFGLLLSSVGIDAVTGVTRLAFGLENLVDGIDWLVLVPALFVVADAAVCLQSPQLFFALYARQIRGTVPPRLSGRDEVLLRAAATAAIAAALAFAYSVNNRWDDLVLLALIGAFGVACRIYGWNRLVLLLAFSVGTILEEDLRRAMLLSQGELEIFFRPAALGFLAAAGLALAAAVYGRFLLRKANPQ
jgi:TctA family transporter